MKLKQILNIKSPNVKKIIQSLNQKEKSWFERYILPYIFKKYRGEPLGIRQPFKKLHQIEKKCFEAMKTIKKNPKECYPVFQDLYHIVIHPQILLIAYAHLIQNKGILTPKIDRQIVEGYSLEKMIHLHETLKTNNYQPKSMMLPFGQPNNSNPFSPGAQQAAVSPRRGEGKGDPHFSAGIGSNPLGAGEFTLEDRIVEESIRFVLEKIYEPMFQIYNSNYGFRNKMSPKDALNKIKRNSKDNNYAIEGHIQKSYEKVHDKILIQRLERNIQDPKLIKLINKFLKAKIFEEEIPQNMIGRIDPLLFNIYMKSFDEYIEKEIKQFIEIINKKQNRTSQGQCTKQTKEILHELQENQEILMEWTSKLNYNWKEINKQKKKIRKIKNKLPKIGALADKKTISHKVTYVRYADDWIMTIFGTRSLTQLIKNKLETFLKTNLKLQLSPDQTIITNLQKNWAYFLGFQLKVQKKEKQRADPRPKTPSHSMVGQSRRRFAPFERSGEAFLSSSWIQGHVSPTDIIITIDIKRMIFKLRNRKFLHHKKPNKSMHQSSWTALSDYQIIQKYRKIIIEIFNDYKDTVTVDDELNWVYYIVRTSCAKTLAMKYKTRTINKIFKKYGSNLKVLHPNSQIPLKFPTLKELSQKAAPSGTRSGGELAACQPPKATKLGES